MKELRHIFFPKDDCRIERVIVNEATKLVGNNGGTFWNPQWR
jgi:hypothetical protein